MMFVLYAQTWKQIFWEWKHLAPEGLVQYEDTEGLKKWLHFNLCLSVFPRTVLSNVLAPNKGLMGKHCFCGNAERTTNTSGEYRLGETGSNTQLHFADLWIRDEAGKGKKSWSRQSRASHTEDWTHTLHVCINVFPDTHSTCVYQRVSWHTLYMCVSTCFLTHTLHVCVPPHMMSEVLAHVLLSLRWRSSSRLTRSCSSHPSEHLVMKQMMKTGAERTPPPPRPPAERTTMELIHTRTLHLLHLLHHLPSDKPAGGSCRGSSCGSPAPHRRSPCARTARPASPRCTRPCTRLSGAPRRRSAGPRSSRPAAPGPGTAAGSGPWCSGRPCSCWAPPPWTAPRRCSPRSRTPAPRSRTGGRRAPGPRRSKPGRAGAPSAEPPGRSSPPSSAEVQAVRSGLSVTGAPRSVHLKVCPSVSVPLCLSLCLSPSLSLSFSLPLSLSGGRRAEITQLQSGTHIFLWPFSASPLTPPLKCPELLLRGWRHRGGGPSGNPAGSRLLLLLIRLLLHHLCAPHGLTLKVSHWRSRTEGLTLKVETLKVSHWRSHTEGLTLKVSHWRSHTGFTSVSWCEESGKKPVWVPSSDKVTRDVPEKTNEPKKQKTITKSTFIVNVSVASNFRFFITLFSYSAEELYA